MRALASIGGYRKAGRHTDRQTGRRAERERKKEWVVGREGGGGTYVLVK
jgi:hypothetical protein